MHKATVTSKGQITIPKEIREFLNVKEKDVVSFEIENETVKTVIIKKEMELETCPACKGKGELESVNPSFVCDCFICEGAGEIEKEKSVLLFLFSRPFRKHNIGLTSIQQELRSDGSFYIREIPNITLTSTEYPETMMKHVQDVFQIKVIEEYARKSMMDETKFMIPSDMILQEIVDLLETEEAKETVRKWFRYERTI